MTSHRITVSLTHRRASRLRRAKLLTTSVAVLLALTGCHNDDQAKAVNSGTFQQETQTADAAATAPADNVGNTDARQPVTSPAPSLPDTSVTVSGGGPDDQETPTTPVAALYTGNPVVAVDPSDSPATVMAKAASVTPSLGQYDWQQMELTGFIHFSVNTSYLANMTLDPSYTNNGTGDESPQQFNPTNLNPKEWLQGFKDAGFKLVVITAKHHNGFHLWPATTTDFSVASSPWKDGKGDVLKEYSDAAKEVGIKIGFYLSPADLYAYRHQKSQVPGLENTTVFANPKRAEADCQIPRDIQGIDPSKIFSYKVDEYNCNYMRDLYDLFTKYGTVSELWLDSFDPTGASQPYSFDKWVDLVGHLQSGVVVSQSPVPGNLLTWVGNEDGQARATTQWSVLGTNSMTYPSDLKSFGQKDSMVADDADRGSRAFLQANRADLKAFWWAPAESDTTIANDGAWFYNLTKATKSLNTLMNIYLTSVGRNTNLILNVGPRADGTMAPDQLDRLKELGDKIKHLYDTKVDMTAGADKATDEHPASAAVSGAENAYWTYPPDGQDNPAALTLTLNGGNPAFFNLIVLQEDIRVGQRVDSFSLDMWDSTTSTWKPVPNTVGKTGTIGHKRILFLGEAVSANKIRLNILQSRLNPAISNVSVYNTSWRNSTVNFVN